MNLRTLTTGLTFGESARWHGGRLWISDWAQGEVLAIDERGTPEVMLCVPTFPFCFDWRPDGTLLIVSGGDARLVRQDGFGALVTVADLGGLSSKPWNEIVVDPLGNAFVNCIGYDFPGGEPGPGLVAVVRPDSTVDRVAGDLAFPNGMAVTDGGATLVVAESHAARLTAFDIAADGTLSGRRMWADLGPGAAPDGICVDAEGAIWYADVPNRRCVRVHEGGQVTRAVELPLGCFSCALGPDTLYLVVADYSDPAAMMTGRTGQVLALDLVDDGYAGPASAVTGESDVFERKATA